MVPKDWEHPKYSEDDVQYNPNRKDQFKPLYDEDYETASENWMLDFELWRQGKHESQPCEYCKYFWEYSSPPSEDSYRSRKWTPEEATCYQVYETVTEGTPVTPVFETQEALIEYLVEHGDFWGQKRREGGYSRTAAESFVKSGSVPSMIIAGGKIYSGIECGDIPKH